MYTSFKKLHSHVLICEVISQIHSVKKDKYTRASLQINSMLPHVQSQRIGGKDKCGYICIKYHRMKVFETGTESVPSRRNYGTEDKKSTHFQYYFGLIRILPTWVIFRSKYYLKNDIIAKTQILSWKDTPASLFPKLNKEH